MLNTLSQQNPAQRGGRGLLIKVLIISLLSGVIVIALAMVSSTISEREGYRNAAVQSIADSYAGPQRLVGPILIQPYTRTVTIHEAGKPDHTEVDRDAYSVFPTALQVKGEIVSSERHHGLYRVPVYELHSHLEATIDTPAPTHLADGTAIAYGTPYLALGVSDVRGLVGTPSLTVNGAPIALTQNANTDTPDTMQLPLRADLTQLDGGKPTHLNVALDLTLAGTQQLSIAPAANTNHIELRSAWPSPLFEGRFLPRTRDVSPAGFNAAWDITSLASATQQQMSAKLNGDMDTLTISLLQPVDAYKLSSRATKYGILFVLLTFAGFFLYEVMNSLPIHPVQYLLIGFGLAIFFLLLISLSEHIPFAAAYSISSVACIGLLGFYLTYVLRSAPQAAVFSVLLTLLYGALYGLLLSEDNALLLGSLLLFLLLAGAMYITRNVDWYRRGNQLEAIKNSPLSAD